MKLFTFFSLCVGFILISPTNSKINPNPKASQEILEDYVLTKFMPESKAVGLGISVTAPQPQLDTDFARGFGHRNMEQNLTVESNTIFNIGSITKGFVGLLAVKVLNEVFPNYGESILELPVKQLLAESGASSNLNWTLNDRYRTDHVSFRDLLSHRVCISGDITGATFGAIPTFEEYIYRIRYETELCPFRTSFEYNNPSFVLAGALIAEISGKPFETLMADFFEDLEMEDTKLAF